LCQTQQTIDKLRTKGIELETRFVDDKPSDRWVDRFLKRHGLRWKKATKLGEARMLAMTPGNVSFMFKAWREAMVQVAHNMHRVYCWDQTPLETDLPRRIRFKAVGMVGSNLQPVVRGRTTIGETFMVWLCIGVMGQVLHPVIIFRGGGDIAEFDVDTRKPGRPRRIPKSELGAEAAERLAGPARLHHNVPLELQAMANEENEELMQEDAEVVRAALQAENEGIEEDLPADIPFRRRVTGRYARFRPAQFPIECSQWGFIKQPSGCTDNYTADEAFKFFADQIEREHPEGPKVVLMDNLVCHQQESILQNLLGRHIYPLFIPPNSTHRFMPLDRVFNGVFKHYYNTEMRECIGANVMPNMRVILTCVSRALDRICPEVTKAGWRGFYPYDRAGMIPVEEQKAAVNLHAKLRRPNLDRVLHIQASAEVNGVPDELRLHPRLHPYPEASQTGIQLPVDLTFSASDFLYRPNHPFMVRRPEESQDSMPLIPPRRPAPAPVEEESSSSDDDNEGSDLDALVPELDELREEIGAPFRRQEQLGKQKKTFGVLGLVTAATIRNEQRRMQRMAVEEQARKDALQEEKRQRQMTNRGRGRERGAVRGVGRGRGRGRGRVATFDLQLSDSEMSQLSQALRGSQAHSSGTLFTSSGSYADDGEEDEEMRE